MKENEKVIISGDLLKSIEADEAAGLCCVLGASLFPRLSPSSSTISPLFPPAISAPLSRRWYFLSFPRRPSPYTREESNDDEIHYHTSTCNANVGSMQEKGASTIRMYVRSTVYVHTATIYLFSWCILSVDPSISRSVYIEHRCATINSNLR